MTNGTKQLSYLALVNFLGHAYLSFGHPEIMVGNMISDFVKGKAQYQLPPGIQKGIRLHRLIDDYTDSHEATHAAKQIFRPFYRLYSAPLVDVVYDHLLASDEKLLTGAALYELSQHTYRVLTQFIPVLPPAFAAMLPYMQRDNWLYGYKTEAGIRRSLQGLMRRASMEDDGTTAFNLMIRNKPILESHYRRMIVDVKHFAKAACQQLID